MHQMQIWLAHQSDGRQAEANGPTSPRSSCLNSVVPLIFIHHHQPRTRTQQRNYVQATIRRGEYAHHVCARSG